MIVLFSFCTICNEKQHPAKNGNPSRFGLSDNFDQDTVSGLTAISPSGSWLAYHYHQERPSDAKLYKYTDSSNLVPAISTHSLKMIARKASQNLCSSAKGFQEGLAASTVAVHSSTVQ